MYERKNEPILPEPSVRQSRPRKNKKWSMTLKNKALHEVEEKKEKTLLLRKKGCNQVQSPIKLMR